MPFYEKDKGTDRGLDSWPNERSSRLGGSSAWAYLTYDPDLNLLFYGTSQPGVWNADMRKGANKWGSSIFARNPENGEVKWVYQVTENDSWDYDAASENIAVDQKLAPADSSARRLLIHLNKNGFAYTFDRETGQILKAEQFVDNVNWATADPFDYTNGLQAVNPNMRVHQDAAQPTKVCPSVLGAKGWEPGAYSPNTKLFYMPTFNFCSTLDALKAEFISGAPYMGASYDITPDLAPNKPFYLSELIAWDAVKGERKWAVTEPAMIYAGVLATAGDVVFYSTQAPSFKAVNAKTGEALWSTSLKCNTVGNPISFQGPDGNQRIAVFSDDACTSGNHESDGGRVHVYKLNP
jgi:alcohol dehydrogenase (cytochrome c)